MEKIKELLKLDLNGYKHFVSIRGNNIKNKIIVYLHDGPGKPDSYLLYRLYAELCDKFTIVAYDRRGCGRSYFMNKNKNNEGLSIKLLESDLDELIKYLLNRFKKKSVIIMGHSYGGRIGLEYAKYNYKRVEAYIGVSQMVNPLETLRLDMDDLASRYNNELPIKYKEAINAFSANKGALELDRLHKQTLECYKKINDSLIRADIQQLIKKSPDYKHKDFKWLRLIMKDERYARLFSGLVEDVMLFNIDKIGSEINVPCYFINGELDRTSRPELIKEYYDKLISPKKELVLLENQGHSPHIVDSKRVGALIINWLNNK